MRNHSHAVKTPEIADCSDGHEPETLTRLFVARSSRRDFLHRLFSRTLAGASILEMGFFRATLARAQAPAASTVRLFDIQKVADSVYFALAHPQALTNCNAAIFVRSQDVVVVDAHSKPSAAAALVAQIKSEVTLKPVRYLVNTHFHWDHTQGDAAYRTAGKVEIIASDITKQLLAQNGQNRLKESLETIPQVLDGLKTRLEKASSPRERQFYQEQVRLANAYRAEMRDYAPELPDITFAKSYVLNDPVHDLHMEFRGRAHTAGDVVVFCPQKRAIATGDAIIGWLPNIADGYPKEWPRTIDSVTQLSADHVLPGHGPVQPNHRR